MQVNIMKSAMKSGLILGILFAINFLLSTSSSLYLGALTYVIMAIILIAAYRFTIQFRDKECEGYITYGRSFLFILFSFFYAGLISSLVKFIYWQFINPDYLTNLYNESMLFIQNMNLPTEEKFEENMRTLLKPASFALQYIWVNTFLGIVVGLIMSIFTKKEKSIFENQ